MPRKSPHTPAEIAALAERLRESRPEGMPVEAWLTQKHGELRSMTRGSRSWSWDEIAAALQTKGYTLLQDPEAAHYVLQANILQVGKSAPTAIEAAIDQGYGVAASGGLVLGAGAAYAGGASGRGIAAAGLTRLQED